MANAVASALPEPLISHTQRTSLGCMINAKLMPSLVLRSPDVIGCALALPHTLNPEQFPEPWTLSNSLNPDPDPEATDVDRVTFERTSSDLHAEVAAVLGRVWGLKKAH